MRVYITLSLALRCLSQALAAEGLVLCNLTSLAVPVSGQGTWETTLQARDINGRPVALNDASAVFLYDTMLDCTWLANWNVNELMNWNAAVAWAAGLNINGFTGWQLPGVTDNRNDECALSDAGGGDCGFTVDTSSSPLAHMYYVTLGNLAYYPPKDLASAGGPQAGWGLTNTGPFSNMQSYGYWSATEYAPNPGGAWCFSTLSGNQNHVDKDRALYAVAVRPGDVYAESVAERDNLELLLGELRATAVSRRRRTH